MGLARRPVHPIYGRHPNSGQPINTYPSVGMTLRQHYAGLAIQGLLSNSYLKGKNIPEEGLAVLAVRVADTLITELEKS